MTGNGFAIDRRLVLRGGALLASSLVIGCYLGPEAKGGEAGRFKPNAFLAIGPDGSIVLSLPKTEMGQSVYTTMAMLVAEELEVEPSRIKVELPPGDPDRFSPVSQETGGSTSVREAWVPLRQAAADARAALIEAAARRWRVPARECKAQEAAIVHIPGGRKIGFGDLVADAAAAPVPSRTPLKPASTFRVIGRPFSRLDAQAKVEGQALYGIDVTVPGMLVGALAQSPTIGGRLATVDEASALKVRGVRQVVRLPDAVAVIADHYWAARKGLDALAATWTPGQHGSLDQAAIVADIVQAGSKPGARATDTGDVDTAMRSSGTRLEAVYDQPFLAHAAMEPGNCVVHVRKDGCDIWTGTQIPGSARAQAAKALAMPLEKVTLHNQLLGGAFGRRLEADMILRTIEVARHVPAPLKLIWSREEDIQHDLYRPYYQDRMAAVLDRDGKPAALMHRITGASIMARLYPEDYKDTDADAIDGAAEILYKVPNHRVEWVRQDSPVPTSWWRGVGGLRSAFAVESFVDEMAAAARIDPVEYRRSLVQDPRALAVLDLAAAKAGWDRPVPEGRGRGVALINLWDTYIAMVAEVEAKDDAEPRVTRVVAAVDCGQPINPAGIRAQVESGVIFALSGILFGEITIAEGRIQQSNYHDVRVLRMNEAPAIETFIVENHEKPGGMGEPPAAAAGPAVVNAIYAATGRRIRSLPVVKSSGA